jgi:hypothetical protein
MQNSKSVIVIYLIYNSCGIKMKLRYVKKKKKKKKKSTQVKFGLPIEIISDTYLNKINVIILLVLT